MKMKILVTGGCGFIGSNYIIQQIASNNQIFNLDKLTYAGNIHNLRSIEESSNYEFLNGDICDNKTLETIFNKFQPDAVIHFAAESHVDRSIDDPLQFIKTNMLGTASLLYESLKYWNNYNNEFRFIHVSTDEVFGSANELEFFTEQTKYKPSSPYSASKAGSDHLVEAWHITFGLPVIITNCSNNYGPYQFPEKLIPLMIANCIDEKNLPIYGEGNNIRDWLFVEDHCNAINTVLKKGVIGECYNIGGNNEISNIDIVKTICSILDYKIPRKNGDSYEKLISFVEDRPGHDYRYAIDSTKIKNDLGWRPIETFETGLQKTISWYLENESWWRKIQESNYSQERLGIKSRSKN